LVVGFLASVLLILTSEYRQARLTTFLTQTHDPLGKSYHIRQVLLSLGLGGIFGTGLGASRQKYLFLPEAATDSIFAVIAEEMGFVGASILIFLFFYFALRAYRISFTAPDKFSKIFALGLTSWIVIQTLLNLGSMLALVPLTGVPLPFISYGGTSLIMTLSVTGILLNISRYAEQKKEKRKR
jgi:cell division protein FtsW